MYVMAVVGSLGEFQSKTESFSPKWKEQRCSLWPKTFLQIVFLSVFGAKTFGLLRSLLAPQKPSEMTLAQVTDVLKAHFEPTPIIITERFQFNQRNQGVGESVTEYLRIPKLSLEQQRCIFPSVELHQSGVVLCTYTTEQLQVVGEMPVYLTYGQQQCNTALLIVAVMTLPYWDATGL